MTKKTYDENMKLHVEGLYPKPAVALTPDRLGGFVILRFLFLRAVCTAARRTRRSPGHYRPLYEEHRGAACDLFVCQNVVIGENFT